MIAISDINWASTAVRMDSMVKLAEPKTQKVEAAASSDKSRNETASGDANPRGLLMPPYDPDAPTGPPPSFEANVLDAEMQKRTMTPTQAYQAMVDERAEANSTVDVSR